MNPGQPEARAANQEQSIAAGKPTDKNQTASVTPMPVASEKRDRPVTRVEPDKSAEAIDAQPAGNASVISPTWPA